jgi:hypothetical protein
VRLIVDLLEKRGLPKWGADRGSFYQLSEQRSIFEVRQDLPGFFETTSALGRVLRSTVSLADSGDVEVNSQKFREKKKSFSPTTFSAGLAYLINEYYETNTMSEESA